MWLSASEISNTENRQLDTLFAFALTIKGAVQTTGVFVRLLLGEIFLV
jgi:hypothetical protein